jgi:transcriptional regulator with XRE-family HTH domain
MQGMARASDRPLAAAVGEAVRTLREQRGLRQDDIARAARRLGFRWTRTAVATLEAGRRRLSAAEFLFLADMVNFAAVLELPEDRRGSVVELADLVPGEGWISLTEESRIQARALRMFVRGELHQVRTTDLDVPMLRDLHARSRRGLAVLHRSLAEAQQIARDIIWPDATDREVVETVHDAAGEAEQKAARRLGVPVLAVALEARRRWGRSLTAERDGRVATQLGAQADRRRLQAVRGHVSRTLLAELRGLPERLSQAGWHGGALAGVQRRGRRRVDKNRPAQAVLFDEKSRRS